MIINTILLGRIKWHHLLPASGDKSIAMYNKVNLLANKLAKAWGDIESILDSEQDISTNRDVTSILCQLNALHDTISQSTSHYVLHPSLVLSQRLQGRFALQTLPRTHEIDKMSEVDVKVLIDILNAYMTSLYYHLEDSSHRAKCVNFERLSRRKRINVKQWLNHLVLSQKKSIFNVVLYSSFNIKNDIHREQLTAALTHLNHTLSNRQSIMRQCNGYVWQLLYDDSIGYYVDWLLAVPTNGNKDTLIKLFYRAWKESWRKVTNLPQDIPLPFVVQDRGSVLSSEHIDESINNITAHYCSLDGIMKLDLPKAVKTYSRSRIPKS